MTNDAIVEDVIKEEGEKYTETANDRGGPTKFGITIPAYRDFLGRDVTAAEIQALTKPEAVSFYQGLIRRWHFDRLVDDQIRWQITDFAVLSGPFTAIRTLHYVLGLRPGQIIGPQTLAALAASDARTIGNQLAVARVRFLAQFVVRVPSQLTFLEGWVRRATKFIH